jgi:hypothetical protein
MHYMALPISFRWDKEFIDQIDAMRGAVPRSAFVRAAIEQALAAAKDAPDRSMREQHRGPMPRADSGGQVTPSSPRASAIAKAGVTPRLKGGKTP